MAIWHEKSRRGWIFRKWTVGASGLECGIGDAVEVVHRAETVGVRRAAFQFEGHALRRVFQAEFAVFAQLLCGLIDVLDFQQCLAVFVAPLFKQYFAADRGFFVLVGQLVRCGLQQRQERGDVGVVADKQGDFRLLRVFDQRVLVAVVGKAVLDEGEQRRGGFFGEYRRGEEDVGARRFLWRVLAR